MNLLERQNLIDRLQALLADAARGKGRVVALSGDTVTFSILANNWNVPAGRVTAAADSIAARLASYRRR